MMKMKICNNNIRKQMIKIKQLIEYKHRNMNMIKSKSDTKQKNQKNQNKLNLMNG